jgi:hypothetical protein
LNSCNVSCLFICIAGRRRFVWLLKQTPFRNCIACRRPALQVTADAKNSDQKADTDYRLWYKFTERVVCCTEVAESPAGPRFPVGPLDSFPTTAAKIGTVKHIFQSLTGSRKN